MFKNTHTKLAVGTALALSAGMVQAAQIVPNSNFESGLNDWIQFDNGGTISLVAENGPSAPGSQAAFLSANASAGASFPIIKVERLQEGFLTDGAPVTISFDARSPLQTVDIGAGDFVGQVVFIAEFFTEKTGDNGAINQILVGPPVWLTQDWQTFTFNTNLAADAGGGVSLLFKADCGANPTCRFDAIIDNVTIDTAVSAVPVPAAVWLFGSGLLGLVGVARRKSRS
jgi:hypothetical protein